MHVSNPHSTHGGPGRGQGRKPLVASEQTTVTELAESLLAAQVSVREPTQENYRAAVRVHLMPYFGSQPIRGITLQDVERFRTHLAAKLTPGTVNKILMVLSMTLNHGVRHRWLSANPGTLAKKLRVARESVEAKIITPGQVGGLLSNAGSERMRALPLTAIMCGLRQGELLGLKWGDIDFERHLIFVRRTYSARRFSEPKSKSSRRRVDFGQDPAVALTRWKLTPPLSKDDLVFPTSTETPEPACNLVRRGFDPALKRAGLPKMRFHELRHT